MTLQEYNDLFKQPLMKKMTITASGGNTITNTNIVSESMSLESSLCSENELRYGACEASCFKIRIADLNHDFTGEWLTVVMDIVTDSDGYLLLQDGTYFLTEEGEKLMLGDTEPGSTSVTLGRFKVKSDKPANDRRWRDLTCYDAMHDLLTADVASWYAALTFPMTIKNLRDSLFTAVGITQETQVLTNDSFVVNGGFTVNGTLAAKDVITAICEMNAVFGHINASGKFEYVDITAAPTLTLDYYVDGSGKYEDYQTDTITGVVARGVATDVGTSVGTTANQYVIMNNPLVYGSEGEQSLISALTNILAIISSVRFRPFEVQTYGNPMLPLGTRITIVTRDMTIVSNVINKNMTGIQGLKDRISALSGQHQPTEVNSMKSDIKRTKGKTHELEVSVNGLTSRTTAIETSLQDDYSTTVQTQGLIQASATSILGQVSSTYVTQTDYAAEVQNLQDQIDGRVNQYTGSAVPTLSNYPASSWSTTAEKRQHIGDLYLVDEQGGTYAGRYFRFNYNQTTQVFEWVLLEDTDVTRALAEAELANQKADAAQAQLDALELNIQNNYSNTTQMNSAIALSEKGIESTVSEAQSKYALRQDVHVDYFGYGNPTSKYPPADNNNKVYFDNGDGYYWTCNGVAWVQNQIQMSLITSNLNSRISQTNDQIVLKVDNNGNIVKVALGTSASGGTVFKVGADNISLIANGVMNLTSNNLVIDSTNFRVSAAGQIEAKSGKIAGFSFGAPLLYSDYISGQDQYRVNIRSIQDGDDENQDAFYIRVSHNGGQSFTYPLEINYKGQLKATDAIISGTVNANAGSIGGWNITASDIRYTNSSDETVIFANGSNSVGDVLVVRTENPTAYPFWIRADGSFHAEKGDIAGWAVDVDSLTATNSNYRAIIKVPYQGGNTSSVVFGVQTYLNSQWQYYWYVTTQGRMFNAGTTQLNGAVYVGTGIDLGTLNTSQLPYVDFHYNDTTSTDFTYRVIQRGTDMLDFIGHNSSTWGTLRGGSFSVQSSKYVKTNVIDITNEEAEKILDLRPVSFDYKYGGAKNQRGLIAEEVEEIYPEMVTIPEGYETFDPEEPWNAPSIDYAKFVPYIIKMIQIQQEQIDELKNR